MFVALALGLTLTLPIAYQSDTTLAVGRGTRLDVQTQAGAIQITAWERDEIQISVDQSGGMVDVQASSGVVRVRPQRGRWQRRSSGRRDRFEWDEDSGEDVGFIIRMPTYMAVTMHSLEADLSVRGSAADVTAETTEGNVTIRGGGGRVNVATVEGFVRVTGARARIDIAAGEGDVTISDVVGEINVESIDGSITITGADSPTVEAATVDGDISYAGSIASGGRYELATHDGDITLTVPSNVSADVTVANFNGGFETNFPVVLRESQRKRLHFTLGSGEAQVRLEAFDGDVILRRRSN